MHLSLPHMWAEESWLKGRFMEQLEDKRNDYIMVKERKKDVQGRQAIAGIMEEEGLKRWEKA